MELSTVVAASQAVAATRSRREKTAVIAELLRHAEPTDLPTAVAYVAGRPTQRALGIGWAGVDRQVTPSPRSHLRLSEVALRLEEIAACAGTGAAGERRRLLADLLSRATAPEQRFLLGLVSDGVRQGAQDAVVADAVAQAFDVPAAAVRRALMLRGDLGEVAALARSGGRTAVAAVGLRVGTPVLPMLAATAPDVAGAADRLGAAAWDWKLDGVRIQVHRAGDDVAVFSRTRDDLTARVPEVVAAVRAVDAREVILDGEVIALHPDGRPRPFPETGGRVASADPALRVRVPLTPVFFDVIHHDGVDLLEVPMAERAAVLDALVPRAIRVARTVTDDPETAAAVMRDALAHGHEGVVAKALDAPYAAGRRGAAWIKVKPRHTADLVVVAAEWGSGRRRGWLSNIHLAARDDRGGLAMVGKTFKGMTDALLVWQTQQFLARETGRDAHVVHVRPELVVEVAFDGVQRSRRYPSGMALRFARVVRYRPDRTAAEADTLDVLRVHLPGSA